MTDIAWHFTGQTLRGGRPIPPIGETLVHEGEIKLCNSGYHWSRTPWQALEYAPGSLLHKVRIGGNVIEGSDKGVSSERTILASIDATWLCRRFAADQALSVAHLWEMPDIVREYLTTLGEGKRVEAGKAASDAAMPRAAAAEEFNRRVYADVAWAATFTNAWAAARAAAPGYYDAASDAAMPRAAAAEEFNRRVYAEFDDRDIFEMFHNQMEE